MNLPHKKMMWKTILSILGWPLFTNNTLFCGKVCIDTITNGKPLQAWLPNINLTMAEFRAKHLLVHRAKSCRTRPFDISWMTVAG